MNALKLRRSSKAEVTIVWLFVWQGTGLLQLS